jgi:type I restriction enzyme S subunit
MKDVERQLTANWMRASLSEVCDISSGCGFPESLQGRREGEIPFYKVGDISEAWKCGKILLEKANNYITRQEAEALKATPLPAATTVFAKIGPSIALNRRVLLSAPGLVDNNVMGLVPNQAVIDPQYLFYFSCTLRLDHLNVTGKVPFIRKSAVGDIRIPLPPMVEQKRIAAEITERLQRLDTAAAGLKSVQEELMRQRSAILEAACSGRLVATEAAVARGEGRSYESAEVLIRNVKIAYPSKRHEETWAEKAIRAKKKPLPEGWAWIKVSNLGRDPESVVRSGPCLRAQDFDESGVPVLNVGCVRWGEFDESKLNYLRERIAAEFKKYQIEAGDILFTRTGSTGRCAVATKRQAGWLLTDHILRTRVDRKMCIPEFVGMVFESAALAGEQTQGSTAIPSRSGLNKSVLSNADVPLAPYREQVRIVAEMQRRVVHLNALQAAVRTSLERSKELRQSILNRAFEGKTAGQFSGPLQNESGLQESDGEQKEAVMRV